jgi:hypothetical protein
MTKRYYQQMILSLPSESLNDDDDDRKNQTKDLHHASSDGNTQYAHTHTHTLHLAKKVCRRNTNSDHSLNNKEVLIQDAPITIQEDNLNNNHIEENKYPSVNLKSKIPVLKSHALSSIFPHIIPLSQYLETYISNTNYQFVHTADSHEYIQFLNKTLVVSLPQYSNLHKASSNTFPNTNTRNSDDLSALPLSQSTHTRMSQILSRVISRALSDSSSNKIYITRSNSNTYSTHSLSSTSSTSISKDPTIVDHFSIQQSKASTKYRSNNFDSFSFEDIPDSWYQLGSVLAFGYRQINERSFSTLNNLPHIESLHPNTIAMNWYSDSWLTLLNRLNDDVVYHLLADCCVFKPLENWNFVQISGPPLTLLYRLMQSTRSSSAHISHSNSHPPASALSTTLSLKRASYSPIESAVRKVPKLAAHIVSNVSNARSTFNQSSCRLEAALRPVVPRSSIFYFQPSLSQHVNQGLPNSRQFSCIILPVRVHLNNSIAKTFIFVVIFTL